MKRPHLFIFAVIFCFFTFVAAAQTTCIDPLEPVLNLVTVQSGTGSIYLEWSPSPSSGIDGYIIHKYSGGIGTPDTIWDPAARSFTYNEVESQYYSLSYGVSAIRLPDCESPVSNLINTIFSTAVLDTCKKEITIKWNRYSDYPKRVLGYEVRSLAADSKSPVVFRTGPADTSFIIRNFRVDTKYFFTVSALLEGGRISGSVTASLTTTMTRPPDWINADFATVDDEKKIELSFTSDPQSEIKKYRLERMTGYSGQFQLVSELSSGDGHVYYTDIKADPEKVNIYRLSAINFCNIPVTTSNLSSNIVVSASSDVSTVNLSWNAYRSWLGHNEGYRLLINTGNGYHEISIVGPPDTTYSVPLQDIMNQVTGNQLCFKVAAIESGNPYTVNGESVSAEKCIDLTEVIIVPDLFTPDGDLVNDLFKPYLSFIPREYHLLISDRKGRVVFETRDPGYSWDGIGRGNPLPADAYLWFLSVTGPSGKLYKRTGTITIFRTR